MANYDVTTAGASLEFDTVNGQYNSCNGIDATHFINFWSGDGNDGYAQVFTINTTTWAVTTANASLEFDTTSAVDNSCYKIDTNHFINFWGGVDSDGFVQVFTVNTTTWAVTTANASLEFDTVNGTQNKCYQIDSNHFVNFWRGTDLDGFVQVFTVSTSTWAVTTAADRLEFDTSACTGPSCYPVDTNHFIAFYGGATNDGYVDIFAINTSTWAVTTASSRLEFDTVHGTFNNCQPIDSTHFINTWIKVATDTVMAQVFTVNTTTWAVTTAGEVFTIDTAPSSGNNSLEKINGNNFLFFYDNDTDPGKATVLSVNTSTWAVTTAGTGIAFETTAITYQSSYKIDTNHYVNFWDGADSDGFVQVFTVELPSAGGPANLKSYNTNLKANIKSINTNVIANVKSLNTNI